MACDGQCYAGVCRYNNLVKIGEAISDTRFTVSYAQDNITITNLKTDTTEFGITIIRPLE